MLVLLNIFTVYYQKQESKYEDKYEYFFSYFSTKTYAVGASH